MAVAFFNANSTSGAASAGSRTLLHTATVGATLLVFTQATNTAVSISAMAAGTNALTRLGAISAGGCFQEVWALTSVAASGTLTISAIPVGASVTTRWCMAAVTYTGAKFTATYGTVVKGTATAANVVFSLSSTTADLVAFGFGISANASVTLNTGNTRASATCSTGGRLVIGDITGAATVSISATSTVSGVWGWLGVPVVAEPLVETLLDGFSATVDTTTVWTADNINGSAVAVSGVLDLTILTAVANNRARIASQQSFNLIGSSVYVKLVRPVRYAGDPASYAETNFELQARQFPSDSGDRIQMLVTADGIFKAVKQLDFAATDIAIITSTYYVDAATHTWWRMRESGGTVFFDTAPLTASNPPVTGDWVNRASVALSTLPATFANCSVALYTYMGTATMGTPTQSAQFDGLNTSANGAVSGIASLTDVHDKFSASGYVVVTGRLSATDVTDKFSASGYVIVSGRMSATAAADRLSATGYVVVSGRMSATGAADTFSASGYTIVSGRMSATDAHDVFSASGYNLISGRLSATDVTDRFSASGYVIVSGRMSATDVTDIFSASGTVVQTGNINGRLSATDAPDRFSASGYVLVQGLVTFTDRPDIFSASGTVVTTVAAPAPPPDTPSLGGKKQKKTEYFRADDAFWDAREKYLLSLQPAIASEPEYEPSTIHAELPNTVPSPIDPSLLIQYRAARSKIVQALPAASSMRQLKAQGKRLYEVNARIAEQKRLAAQHEELLRLAKLAKEARQRKRAQDIRRIKRRVKLLAVARAAVALTYLLDKL